MNRIGLAAALIGILVPALPAAPQRIITAGGTVTEIVFALGRGAQVVGIDSSSLYPPQALARLPQVGYVRQLSAEGLVSLGPDLVLTTVDAGPPGVLAQVEAAGVRVVRVPAGNTWDAARARILFVADLLAVPDQGQSLINRLTETERRIRARQNAAKDQKPARVLFVYARGAGALMVSGTGTEADAMIRLAGGMNAVTGYEGYRPLTPEALAAAQPDLLLFTSLGLASVGGAPGLAALPAFADRVTLAHARVGALDDLLLLGFGPRLGEAVEALEALLPPPR